MREIRFRAFDEELRKMYSGDEIEGESNLDTWLSYGEVAIYRIDNGEYVQLKPLQYTGLLDKNGNEIFEGDVVDTIYDGKLFTGVVVYDESELDFKATNGKENYGSNFQYLPCCEEVEVIGNLYENPELLKRGE
ncbi:hypothetical protein JFU54_28755 [Bacillus sp. TH19]|uniref:YopX family protein n=1 Tax=Bacillus sp. TH19 TaxID=2796385 RepID=UPI001912F547|nr:YopX family protein [Bacillus sp. TH19]MBK5474378.1 hypothetical protein [Bacillus sp. TH19]